MIGARAVVLLSGGLDSGTALAMWLENGGTVDCCVCADYGQLAAVPEARASAALARRFALEWQVVELPWLARASLRAGTALVQGSTTAIPLRSLDAPGDHRSAAAVWVPARNVVLIAVAAALAEASGCTHVVAGFNREEAATFADNSVAFCDDFDRVLARGTRNGVRVASPTSSMDKVEIAATARRLGLGPDAFWSCYRAESDPATCACESCVRSRRAWGAVRSAD